MRTVHLDLRKTIDPSYDIMIRPGLLEQAGGILVEHFGKTSFALVTDDNVTGTFAGPLAGSLAASGCRRVEIITIPAGEKSKTREIKQQVEDSLFGAGFGRDSVVVAVGGGVVGDLAGFVAATYTRGVPLVQVPTTLLAMFDSSVGGKTGVDVPWGKNLLGAFHQPALVLIDPRVLASLDRRQFASGMAEAVKHGVIRDESLFRYIEQRLEDIRTGDENVLAELIEINCRIKAAVVSEDERESNLRQILNYGHTLGHAIEALSEYRLLHGEAVSVGMVLEAGISMRLGLFPAGEIPRLEKLLQRLGLPTRVDLPGVSAMRILEHTVLDKKSRGGRARYALPSRIGVMATDPDGGYGIEADAPVVLETLRERGAK